MAKAEEIKIRYWLQVITPSTSKGEYWLEAYPKTMADAGNLLDALAKRGHSADAIEKIMHGNLLRVYREVWGE